MHHLSLSLSIHPSTPRLPLGCVNACATRPTNKKGVLSSSADAVISRTQAHFLPLSNLLPPPPHAHAHHTFQPSALFAVLLSGRRREQSSNHQPTGQARSSRSPLSATRGDNQTSSHSSRTRARPSSAAFSASSAALRRAHLLLLLLLLPPFYPAAPAISHSTGEGRRSPCFGLDGCRRIMRVGLRVRTCTHTCSLQKNSPLFSCLSCASQPRLTALGYYLSLEHRWDFFSPLCSVCISCTPDHLVAAPWPRRILEEERERRVAVFLSSCSHCLECCAASLQGRGTGQPTCAEAAACRRCSRYPAALPRGSLPRGSAPLPPDLSTWIPRE